MQINRRKFIAASAISMALARVNCIAEQRRLPLAFSTLACPDWEWTTILQFAVANKFAAIELRGLMGTMDLPGRPEFSKEELAKTNQEIASRGLKIACVSSSSKMQENDPELRERSLADARRFIDIAAGLNAPYVRVFGNEIKGPK